MSKQPHIQLDDSINCQKAIICGDPMRIDKIAMCLDSYEELQYNREFRSIKGTYKGENILALSTGIGAPSTCIAIEELNNINVKEIIRVGSCGAMQQNINLGDIVIATASVRDDGLTSKYVPQNFPAIPDIDLITYAKEICSFAKFGIIRSHDGFYMDNNSEVESYWSKYGVIAADMESGVLFVLGAMRNIKTLSILNNVVLYEASLQDGVNDLVLGESLVANGELKTINLALNILTRGK